MVPGSARISYWYFGYYQNYKTSKKRNIFIDSLNDYDEIIVIGSGKGVVSVSSIKKPLWKRKSLKIYRNLSKIYQLAVTNCPRYNGWSIIVSVLKTTDRGRK